ncbi:MAG: hypothetical protein AB1347_12095 [Acidobacteriota bacterium]
MPHARLRGEIPLPDVWKSPPALRFSVPEEDLHVKFLEALLGGAERSLLLRYVVAEGRLNQTVGVLLAVAEDGWILKLDTACPTLRSPGVKLLLATVAAWLERMGLEAVSSTVEAYRARGAFYAEHADGEEAP